jgi:uncharacterized protein
MRWRRSKKTSEHLEDQRGASSRASGFQLPIGGKAGLPVILIMLVVLFLGGRSILGGGDGGAVESPLDQLPGFPAAGGGSEPGVGSPDPDSELVDFMSFLIDDIQATWEDVFRRSGRTYEFANLVLFTQVTDSGCGQATSAVGPFYCPPDRRVYLDLDFFRELHRRFGAPGDFAQAYVIAHEIGHHVQNLLGINADVRRMSEEDPDRANDLSVRQELQADCLAGVWAHTIYERGDLETGDLEEGLGAAAAVGDDRIQKEATGSIDPDTWTHGSSEQRVRWFKVGFDTGDPERCDTFSADI